MLITKPIPPEESPWDSYDADGDARIGLEHDRTGLLSERRLQKQLAALADQCPDHMISTECYPGRGRRLVARARPGTAARPWLVLTADVDELRAALSGSPGHL